MIQFVLLLAVTTVCFGANNKLITSQPDPGTGLTHNDKIFCNNDNNFILRCRTYVNQKDASGVDPNFKLDDRSLGQFKAVIVVQSPNGEGCKPGEVDCTIAWLLWNNDRKCESDVISNQDLLKISVTDELNGFVVVAYPTGASGRKYTQCVTTNGQCPELAGTDINDFPVWHDCDAQG